MSLTRNLVDLYMLATAATKVGSSAIASQSSSLCLHVKTSSLLNPTSMHHDHHEQAIEVPFPDFVEQTVEVTSQERVETTVVEHTVVKEEPLTEQLDTKHSTIIAVEKKEPSVDIKHSATIEKQETRKVESSMDRQEETRVDPVVKDILKDVEKKRVLKESHIPTSRFGRLWNYGTLATGMGMGAINESLKRATGLSQDTSGSVMLSENNVNRLVDKLSRMRGAALKMGQMLSIQGIQASGEKSGLPPQLEEILLRVHDSANYMPQKQMEKVMAKELGTEWRSQFKEFDPIPIAAASIGQVHAATLASTGESVVIKIQYPGVAESIDSDLSNLKALVTFSNLLPRGLYLDNTIKVTKEELAWECDYIREANNAIRFKHLLEGDARYKVPSVVQDLCTKRVLVSERLQGRVLSKAVEEPQAVRDDLGEHLLRLCLREVFSFRFMQTDPNWSNFFYNQSQVELLDFGACREYSESFLQQYGRILMSAARDDREGVWQYSKELGFVTGYETQVMRDAHIDSVMVLGSPFSKNAPDIYDFQHQTITQRVRETIPVMLRHRLTPPPDETYGLHKKLSGAFLLCTKLGSRFDTKAVWREEVESKFKL
ncbi:ABC1 family-domain-containing protein [Mucor mucedo]|uniref:ABC1 family-domain-containing protein n=1 Tax=Mucor mucedo TaxID=29922 RepID=UPI00221FA40A|nr:ABC1 family-domain-containing protein [Mucor mucedo]KAI7894549.1 ABC1 family-domain-containing protein [Mucor mucedo]